MRTPRILSDRDCEIISRLREGEPYAAIAEAMGLSEHGRRIVAYRIQKLLGFDNLTEVRLWASPISDAELNRFLGRSHGETARGQSCA